MIEILLSFIIAAIIILALFLIVLMVRQPQAVKVKSDKFSLEELTYSPIFKKAIKALMPQAEEREYRQNERLISDSGVNISMRVLYLFKICVPIIIMILLLSIYFMNKEIMINAIVTDSLVKTVNVIGGGTESSDYSSNAEKKKSERAWKDTFEIMDNLVDENLLNSKDILAIKLFVQEVMLEKNLTTEANLTTDTNKMTDMLLQVNEVRKINVITIILILVISLMGYYIPNVYLVISRLIRHQAFDNEIIALEMLTIMVGSIENVTVKEILRILSLNSKAFKPNFEKALLEYPIDFEQALINLGDSSKNKDFQALVSTLRQCATSDKYNALQTLQRRRISRKEYRKLMEEKKIETKMYIAFIMLIPVLFFLAKLLLSPWQDLMNTSGLM